MSFNELSIFSVPKTRALPTMGKLLGEGVTRVATGHTDDHVVVQGASPPLSAPSAHTQCCGITAAGDKPAEHWHSPLFFIF